MLNVKIKNSNGYILDLTNNQSLFKLVNIDGLNPTKTNIFSSDVYTMDGAIFNYAKDEIRNIVIEMYLDSKPNEAKQKILKAFQNRKKITIFIADMYSIEGYTESIDYNFFSEKIACQISIVCLYPYFKDINTNSYILSDTISLFSFPFAIENRGVQISTIDFSNRLNVINNGTVKCGCIINALFSGTVENLMIKNYTNGCYVNINKTFYSGDILKIDTISTLKTFKLNNVSIISNVDIGNEFFELEIGNNSIEYTCTNNSENVQIEFLFNNVYTGI